jgi:hypothetical protein
MFRTHSLWRQFALLTTLLAIGCLSIGIFVLYPTLTHMYALSTDIRGLQSEREKEYTNTQAMRRTLRELDTVTAEVSQYANMAITTGDELSIITELEQLALEHSLSQTLGASYQATPDKEVRLPYYTFTFVLNGSFEDSMAYLRTLETRPYYVLIHSISLTKATSQTVTVRFEARIYVKQS